MVASATSSVRAGIAVPIGHIDDGRPAIGALVSGIFEIRTLFEAEALSTMLASQYPDPDRVSAGIWELLSNAIEHGNLEIDFQQKGDLLVKGRFQDEIQRRLTLMPYAGRAARVSFRRTRRCIRLTVKDEGPGFDFKRYMQTDVALDLPNGRGIAIASRVCFDNLTYHGPGNEVEAVLHVTSVQNITKKLSSSKAHFQTNFTQKYYILTE